MAAESGQRYRLPRKAIFAVLRGNFRDEVFWDIQLRVSGMHGLGELPGLYHTLTVHRNLYAAVDAYSGYVVWVYDGVTSHTAVSVLRQYSRAPLLLVVILFHGPSPGLAPTTASSEALSTSLAAEALTSF